jgi:hypothetical protein
MALWGQPKQKGHELHVNNDWAWWHVIHPATQETQKVKCAITHKDMKEDPVSKVANGKKEWQSGSRSTESA